MKKNFKKISVLVLFFILQKQFLVPIVSPSASDDKTLSESYANTIRVAKAQSIEVRKHLWQQSIELTKNNPLGMGFGQFRFNTFPFRYQGISGFKNNINNRSPHNEFVRMALEGGVVYLIITMILLAQLLFQYFKKLNGLNLKKQDFIILSLSAILFLESLFHFPMEMVHPLFCFALIVVLVCCRITGCRQFHLSKQTSYGYIVVLLAVVVLFITNKQNPPRFITRSSRITNLACRYNVYDWRYCLKYVRVLKGDESKEILKDILFSQPFNIHLMSELAHFQLVNGQSNLACLASKIYEHILNYEKYAGPEFDQKCNKVRIVQDKNLSEDYSYWLKASKLEIHPIYRDLLN